ncbi:MAG: hypothetical protein K9I34_04305 [Bacteroidales bacterium]|nr:hypothetical protein [Bacteroidales bacterium]
MFITLIKKILTGALIIVTLSFAACSTDFSINGEWQDIAVVYSLLDCSDTAQYVRLNRAFLGEGNAYEMALIKDSIYYDQASVYLTPVVNDVPVTAQRVELFITDEIEKDSGIFYYDENYLYKTTQSLSSDSFMVEILIPGKEPVTSQPISLINGLSVITPAPGNLPKISFANYVDFTSYTGKLALNEDALLYGLTIRLNYKEVYADSIVSKYLDWTQANKKKEYEPGSMYNYVEWSLDGEEFFWYLGAHIVDDDAVIFREYTGVDFIYSAAGEELVSYIETNGPSQGIIQEKPFFTNIINGIGLFSSRFKKTINNKVLNDDSIHQLACSEYTKHLRFKDIDGEYGQCE